MTVGFRSTTNPLTGLAGLAVRRPRARPSTVPVPATGQILPERSVPGRALSIVVAIMSFLACITVGAVTLVSDASLNWQADIARELTVQIQPVSGVDPDMEARKAAVIARSIPGVAGATALSDEENLELLEPWLGVGLSASDLPLPRLVVIQLSDPDAVDIDALQRRLAAEVQGASLDDHRTWTDRLDTMADATIIIGVAVLALVFTATVLCVVFATSGAMAGNRDIVSVLHNVGAEDKFVAAEFQRHFLLLGLRGGFIGALLAALLFFGLGLVVAESLATPEGDQVSALFGQFAVGPVGYLSAAGIAVAIALLTAVTSRLTVHRYLADMD
jgi:cell division transport system permease protein